LVGAWPSEPLSDVNEREHFSERIENYMLKAIREAKQNTSWINRNAEYETAVLLFLESLLKPDPQNRFLNDFLPFQQRVARAGLWNSLAQTLLKLTCPGVPDIYQGNELWDFSLVDPDNRRPVDYFRRQQMFQDVRKSGNDDAGSSLSNMLETPEDGRLKLFMIWKTLSLRQQQSDLFREGEYVPLAVEGAKANHVVAFARKSETTNVLVVVPRLVGGLLNDNTNLPPIGPGIWEGTHVRLPFCSCSKQYRNAFTGAVLAPEKAEGCASIPVSEVLAEFPVALCILG
jgi:(1->4)-alpha-D-glucan 1-alpha-D-glucosylmutase